MKLSCGSRARTSHRTRSSPHSRLRTPDSQSAYVVRERPPDRAHRSRRGGAGNLQPRRSPHRRIRTDDRTLLVTPARGPARERLAPCRYGSLSLPLSAPTCAPGERPGDVPACVPPRPPPTIPLAVNLAASPRPSRLVASRSDTDNRSSKLQPADRRAFIKTSICLSLAQPSYPMAFPLHGCYGEWMRPLWRP